MIESFVAKLALCFGFLGLCFFSSNLYIKNQVNQTAQVKQVDLTQVIHKDSNAHIIAHLKQLEAKIEKLEAKIEKLEIMIEELKNSNQQLIHLLQKMVSTLQNRANTDKQLNDLRVEAEQLIKNLEKKRGGK